MRQGRQTVARRKRRASGGSRGMTLIELVIAIGLSIVLSVVIYAVVLSQSRAYGVQDQMTRLQQNLRFAMDFVSRNVAMAGYGTPGYTLVDPGYESTGILPAIRGLDGGGAASDELQVVYADPSKLVMTAWASNHECTAREMQLQNASEAAYFSDVEAMLCFDYSDSNRMKSFVFGVTSVNTDTGVVGITPPVENSDYAGSKGQCPSGDNMPRDLQCGVAQALTFYIDRLDDGVGPGSPDHPTLMVSTGVTAFAGAAGVTPSSDDMALADNIEDFQVHVCRSTVPECDDDSDWSDWTSADNTATGVLAVRQVKITMWARADRKEASGASVDGAPNPLTGEQDGYKRSRESTTVLVRNLRLLDNYN